MSGDTHAAESSRLAFRRRPVCEVCGGDAPETLYECAFDAEPVRSFLRDYYAGRAPLSELAGGVYAIRRCAVCGFLWQGEVLADAGLEALYEIWIDAEESHAKARNLPLFRRAGFAHQVSLAACLLDRPPSEIRALDFGMGWGVWCDMARAFGFAIAGAELSASRIAHAQARDLEVVTSLFDSDRSFDIINTEQVFEHIADPAPVLHGLAEHLAPGGLLRISVPDASRFLRDHSANRWRPGKDAMHPLEHVNGFTHSSLLRFAAQAKLRPVGVGRFLRAHRRAVWRNGSLNLYAGAESLYGQFRGLSVWFEHANGS